MARTIDRLGRVALPAELRRILDLKPGDLLDIRSEQGRIVMERVRTTCALCGGARGLRAFNDKHVCGKCLAGLRDADPATED